MKKFAIALLIIILTAALALGIIFYTRYYPGLKGALKAPPEDIAKIIEEQELFGTEGVNVTDFPLTLPPGFKISIFAKDLPKARVMILDPAGNMLVSQTREGKISHLKIENGQVIEQNILADNLTNPHGMAFLCEQPNDCKFYIAEEHQITRADYNTELTLSNQEKIADLPSSSGLRAHFTRTIGFGPDGLLYAAIGSSCNVCIEKDPLRTTIQVMEPDGSNIKSFAYGLRNAVFFTWHPVTGEMWATEMGRDEIGDDIPPDEIVIVKEGNNYGWPYFYGRDVRDETFMPNTKMEIFGELTPSYFDIQAHSAPLGLTFVPEEGWPEEYWYDLLVAYHGSWNRTVPTGYKIYRFRLDKDGIYQGEGDFISGWLLENGEALGRPADVLALPGGILYISDDKAGVIYKVTYSPENVSNPVEPSFSSEDLILISPDIKDPIQSPIQLSGQTSGLMFFEGNFDVMIEDANSNPLGRTFVQAQGDWMTEEFVVFQGELTFDKPETETGFLIFQKDNPSDLAENDFEIIVPITFASSTQ